MSAVALLAEAAVAGASVRLAAEGRLQAPASASPELLARLREHKAELVELLSGNRCKCCGGPIAWNPDARAVTELGGMAMHLGCYEAAEIERYHRRAGNALSPEALADEGELVVHGEALP